MRECSGLNESSKTSGHPPCEAPRPYSASDSQRGSAFHDPKEKLSLPPPWHSAALVTTGLLTEARGPPEGWKQSRLPGLSPACGSAHGSICYVGKVSLETSQDRLSTAQPCPSSQLPTAARGSSRAGNKERERQLAVPFPFGMSGPPAQTRPFPGAGVQTSL